MSERLIRQDDPTNRYRKPRKRAAYEVALIAARHIGDWGLDQGQKFAMHRIIRGVDALFGAYGDFTPSDAGQVVAKAIRVERGRRKETQP